MTGENTGLIYRREITTNPHTAFSQISTLCSLTTFYHLSLLNKESVSPDECGLVFITQLLLRS